jgi:4-diphosphocytidyl-2-C-methyl-D-erythritol kinase
MNAPDAARAPAKINLTLRILGRRSDGYHALESLVVFADVADDVTLMPGDELGLTVRGEGAVDCGPVGENLVITAARSLRERAADLRTGHFTLTKRLPVAAGVGGGSSDAAAVLRLLARANGIALTDARLRSAAQATGADVPVCLDPVARMMRGIGEVLSAPLRLPVLPAVLVNPRVPVATKAVFAALHAKTPPDEPDFGQDEALDGIDARALLAYLKANGNDLEPAAVAVAPVVGAVIAALRAADACQLARMSGSGGTCFGLFETAASAVAAAEALKRAHPDWWVEATAFNSAQA